MTAVEEYSEAYKTNHIMWLFGTGWFLSHFLHYVIDDNYVIVHSTIGSLLLTSR